MNQLKFVRSKSTTRSSPLKRIHQKLRQVQKPGKLNVSVGKSRQSSENKDALQISTPKDKVQKILHLLSIHQRNNKQSYLQTPERTQSFVPLSHERKLFNESIKLQDSTHGICSRNNIYQKQILNDQIINMQPKMEISTITEKIDAFQLKLLKINSSDQTTFDQQSPSNTIYGNTNISQFNYKKDILQSSYSINQHQNSDLKQQMLQKHQQQIITKNAPKSQAHSRQNSIKNQSKENFYNLASEEQVIKKKDSNNDYEEIILDIYPQFLKQCQKDAILKKTIVEQTEEEEHCPTKLSTKSPQQNAQLYSELLTDKSLVIVSPKVVKDMEMQTSFTQPKQKLQETVEKQSIQTQFDTVNASVQTKSKKKNLGLFQYQFQYLSPQNNNNHQDIDLLSLADFQSEILHRTQSEFDKDFNSGSKNKLQEIKNQKIRDFSIHPSIMDIKQQNQQQNDSRSFLLSQKSNLYLSKEQLLDPQDDNQPYYLQAEPKEINSNFYLKQLKSENLFQQNSLQNSVNQSKNKVEKGSSFSSTQCYKDHLNILLSQSQQQGNAKASQNNPYLNQSNSTKNKQKQSFRNTSVSNQKTKKRQNCINTKK
ncbi:unnamed protein product [Paramecium sonneborni]|uniref:Uncharacterized protein n=1 Tax=Paramecium sonneborni TaxID=65129 RepID=A0A8S1MY44_9CILI|nr:unnamed protein product [Paramecium sonneborni]